MKTHIYNKPTTKEPKYPIRNCSDLLLHAEKQGVLTPCDEFILDAKEADVCILTIRRPMFVTHIYEFAGEDKGWKKIKTIK